jgi:hypothetical protein
MNAWAKASHYQEASGITKIRPNSARAIDGVVNSSLSNSPPARLVLIALGFHYGSHPQ